MPPTSLPDSVPAATLAALNATGTAALGGAQLLLVNDATAPDNTLATQAISSADVLDLLIAAGAPPATSSSQMLVTRRWLSWRRRDPVGRGD